MALSQTSSSRMTFALMGLQPVILESLNAMNAVDGATIERRIRINRPDDENARCKGSRAWDPRKDFSLCMQQPTTLSTSSAISPQQERTKPSGHRPCRRGVKSSLRREPDEPGDLLRARFGNVTVPSRRRNGVPTDDHSRLGPGDGLGDGRQRSGYLRFLRPARVRRLSWPDAETTLVRRQGTVGPRLEDGQSIFAEIARRGRACGPLSSQAARRRAAILGEKAHADQALQACRRRARQ